MAPLSSQLRSLLERAVVTAHDEATRAARAALATLAVQRSEPFVALSQAQRQLRNALRTQMRRLGDGSSDDGFELLVEAVAYAQWHQMLFARFLAENHLLMHPSGVAVTLEECAELARESAEPDVWKLAVQYVAAMLPDIFSESDPAVQVRFAPEGRQALERILIDLPSTIFTGDDALGWGYQFWQSKKKDEVNRSGRKICAHDLAAVTQLFTDDYIVQFLLEHSLGAWWATRHPKSPLLDQFSYLQNHADAAPTADHFATWPGRVADVTVLDPCCGSGHFLIAAFEMLWRMRMEEDGLSKADAIDAVLRDNVFGLELDLRCTQIAAFGLVFAAWKAGGYRQLPSPQIACSGTAVVEQLEEWTKLVDNDSAASSALEQLYNLFYNAPDVGSLISPLDSRPQERVFDIDYANVEPLLTRTLSSKRRDVHLGAVLAGSAAESVARAARILAGTYTLVATNVPYLTRGKQCDKLTRFCDEHYPNSKADLATVFLERCRAFCKPGGLYALVTPQNWLFLGAYKQLRENMLRTQTWHLIARLGEGGFESHAAAGAFTALFVFGNGAPPDQHLFSGIDASAPRTPAEKKVLLQHLPPQRIEQSLQLRNPHAAIALLDLPQGSPLSQYARLYEGMKPGQTQRVTRMFWEVSDFRRWQFLSSSPSGERPYSGNTEVILAPELLRSEGIDEANTSGKEAWGQRGVLISKMRSLPASIYLGAIYDNNTFSIVPKDQAHLPAIWAFVVSGEFVRQARAINQKLDIALSAVSSVSFDLAHWEAVAGGSLPEPLTDDPTQWLFGGHPVGSTEPLQVAVARLVGYHWPQQMVDGLDAYADTDGIVCLIPTAGEQAAAEQLRALLVAAYDEQGTSLTEERLLESVGSGGQNLGAWLRDDFFKQHCALFHNRPFIWHIWDGRKDGFAALVNYHKLDAARLDKLIYTYLGSWIETQRAGAKRGEAGADGRLVAALELQAKLIAIRTGEPPYDIYVRWKPLRDQAIGWTPDLNDGIRLNIRPFVVAGVLRAKFTIHWNKDRGTNPDGSERLNDLHYTSAEKQAARRM
jgi:hypothetical protein